MSDHEQVTRKKEMFALAEQVRIEGGIYKPELQSRSNIVGIPGTVTAKGENDAARSRAQDPRRKR